MVPIEANISLPGYNFYYFFVEIRVVLLFLILLDAVKSATLGGNPNNYTIESLLKDLKARDEVCLSERYLYNNIICIYMYDVIFSLKAIIVCGHDIRALRKEKNDLLVIMCPVVRYF